MERFSNAYTFDMKQLAQGQPHQMNLQMSIRRIHD